MSDYYHPAQKDAKDQILALAARPEGMHSSDLPEYASGYLTSRCHILVNDGLIHRARISHKHVRFFTCAKAAQRAEQEALIQQVSSAKPSLRTAGFAKDAKVVLTSKTKFTQCPGYQPRFQAVDTPFLHSANQAGRVLAEAQQG